MAILYLVTESERDALFYKECAKRLGRRVFSWDQPKQLRKGQGSAAVRVQLKYALQQAKAAAGGDEEVCFIAAIDNDRSPHAENHPILLRDKLSAQERDREARLPWVQSVALEILDANPAVRRLLTAFAVPVEMLEAWTVKALDAEHPGDAMPHFSWQHQKGTIDYYHPVKPPLQWKDLEQQARDQIQLHDDEAFYGHVVVGIAQNSEKLIAKSPSFEHFYQQLAAW